ncbi:hypothetical protein QBC42DRAFT_190812, partial [Cladorrhinum samala]
YITLFRRDVFRVNWTNIILKNKFYRGLKPRIKDKLIKEDRYTLSLNKYINKAIIINNYIFKRIMEDKGIYYNP